MVMNALMKFASLAAVLVLSACVATEPASRGVAPDALTLASRGTGSIPDVGTGVRVVAPLYSIADVRVAVPRSLRVSEANVFYPIADIVWRGDAPGDRHSQIAAIFQTAGQQAAASMNGPRPAVLELTLVRFHGVTEKTRYTVGGTHNMVFDLTVRDAATGAVIDGPRRVAADAKAAGGQAAIAEEQAGRTQKVVVTEKLVETLRRELSGPVTDPALVARAVGSPATVALR
ncbi:hypothetical protein GU927_000590 [Rhodobacteraceae bacterium HSP-20]|uniref:ABC-type transport auxiliary lipoprotein component domain-containing protein n=1 Tax=Paragemmobacter amnigenus TaxID=2852097 RepID=A0ABS6IZB0_9RHOB|nr:DUF6778 family protein [Rhodobacter amnigenus]MBU9696331.1 hypothetical protein [Rhodobacter amnigenus]MBV4387558.1 hypothetical protein [Rhodobacter amnigenus]